MLGGKYVGQECGELCNPLLVRRKLLGKSCRDGCNVRVYTYIYIFILLQFFTSTLILNKNSLWIILMARLNGSFELFFDYFQFVKVGLQSNSLFAKYKNREYFDIVFLFPLLFFFFILVVQAFVFNKRCKLSYCSASSKWRLHEVIRVDGSFLFLW